MGIQIQENGTPQTFGDRLSAAISAHPRSPEGKIGRLTWLKKELEAQADLSVSIETVRKWLLNEVTPRTPKVHALAKTLHVDPGWLSLGVKPVTTTTRGHHKEVASASGACLLVAGILGLEGYACAFPDEKDKTAKAENVHLYAIVQGAQIKLTITHGEPQNSHVLFSVEGGPPQNTVIGVLDGPKPLSATLLNLTGMEFEPHGGYSTLILPREGLTKHSIRKVADLRK